MTKNCAYCGAAFTTDGHQILCDRHMYHNGKKVRGIKRCKVCDVPFLRTSGTSVNCSQHRKLHAKPTEIHRAPVTLPGSGCLTCGGDIPTYRLDRYCRWEHDPELLTASEAEALRAKHERQAG